MISFSIRLDYTADRLGESQAKEETMAYLGISPAPASWVKARAQCSLVNVLKELLQGAKADVEDARGFLHPHSHTTLNVAQASNIRFSVIRVHDPIMHNIESVDFEISGNELVVYKVNNGGNSEMYRFELTLNRDCQCKLRVVGQNEELEQWQVRRMTLEKLLLG
jgi:hypothetical protein